MELNDSTQMRDNFLGYAPGDVMAPEIPSSITSNLSELGRDLEKLVSRGYDRATMVRGKYMEIHSIISKKYPKKENAIPS